MVTEAPAYDEHGISIGMYQYDKPIIIEIPEKPFFESPTSSDELYNCYAYVKNRIEGVTFMAAIIPNTKPAPGVVAVEWFGHIKHVSIVETVEPGGVWVSETNYRRGQFTERFIPFDSPRLHGFWHSKEL